MKIRLVPEWRAIVNFYIRILRTPRATDQEVEMVTRELERMAEAADAFNAAVRPKRPLPTKKKKRARR